jgi:hypothetical protein
MSEQTLLKDLPSDAISSVNFAPSSKNLLLVTSWDSVKFLTFLNISSQQEFTKWTTTN